MLKAVGARVLPPPGVKSPALWGEEAHQASLFGSRARVSAQRRNFVFRYGSPTHWVEIFRTLYGPIMKAFAVLDDEGRKGLVAELAAAPKMPGHGPPSVRVRSRIVAMTDHSLKIEVITSVQRRRRWSAAEKMRMVEETNRPGATVSLVARRHGVGPNQLFTWRRLAAQGALTAAAADEEVIPASEHRALQQQVRELQRLLGKKTLEAEILKEALELAGPKKHCCCARPGQVGTVRRERGRRDPGAGALHRHRTVDAGRTSAARPSAAAG